MSLKSTWGNKLVLDLVARATDAEMLAGWYDAIHERLSALDKPPQKHCIPYVMGTSVWLNEKSYTLVGGDKIADEKDKREIVRLTLVWPQMRTPLGKQLWKQL